MSNRDRDRFRSYESGCKKREKKQIKQDFLKTQQGSFLKFLSKENDKLDSQSDVILATKISTISQVNSEAENLELEREKSPKLSSICLKSPKALNKDSELPQTIISNFKESNSVEFQEILSCKLISNESKIILTNTAMNDSNMYDDPANWPISISQDLRTSIVKLGPKRTINFNFPSRVIISSSSEKEVNRRFSTNFYYRKLPNGEIVDRNWLVYSISKDHVFCFCCKLFGLSVYGSLSGIGTNDWSHLGTKLIEHERSLTHFRCTEKWFDLKIRIQKMSTIDKTNLEIIEREKTHWRNVLKRIIAAIHYLAKHNEAFRGSSDVIFTKNNGKFLGLIEMIGKFDTVMGEHLNKIKNHDTRVHYLGHDIQENLIKLMAVAIKTKIIHLIKSAKYYTIIMDTTPDISRQEQLSIVIRIVNMEFENEMCDPQINEFFMDFINIESTTGFNLANVLIEQLQHYDIDLQNCRGQAYDNGRNMIGQYKGVQSRILNQNPRAFFTPCAAHNLNLLIKDAANSSTIALLFFGTVERIYSIFSSSTQRWDILKKHCNLLTVKKWAETRWESRLESVKSIRFQFKQLTDALKELFNTTTDGMFKSESQSLLKSISCYEFILSTVIWYDILLKTNIVSKSLQGIETDISLSENLLKGLMDFFEEYRENGFEKAKLEANILAKSVEVPQIFKLSRLRKKARMFNYESEDNSAADGETIFRTTFFIIIIDQALSSLNLRFNQFKIYNEKFGFLFYIGKLKEMEDDELMKNCKDLHIYLMDGEHKDIDGNELYHELQIFKSLVEISTTALQSLSMLKKLNGSFPNITVALRIMLTIPITSASAERSFSKLKLIKNYLRSTMSQTRLTGLSTISIEKDIAETINYDTLINDFANEKSRKKSF